MQAPWLISFLPIMIFLTATSALGQVTNAFKTPTGNIACAVYENYLRCDLRVIDTKPPPSPKDCELDWGHAFSMDVRGKPGRICAGDFVGSGTEPVLDYGKTWEYQGFRCNSEKTGLTCVNQNKQGWMLKRSEQRLF